MKYSHARWSSILILVSGLVNQCKCHVADTTITSQTNQNTYEPPVPLVEAFTPRGLRVSIQHEEGIELFAFHGKINSQIRRNEAGNLSQDILYPTGGRWVFQTNKVVLRVGDVINYWIFLQVNGTGYRVDRLSSVITELIPGTLPVLKRDRPCQNVDQAAESPGCNTGSPHTGASTSLLAGNLPASQLVTQPPSLLFTTTTFKPTSVYRPSERDSQCHCPVQDVKPPTTNDCSSNDEHLKQIRQQLDATLTRLQSLHDTVSPLQSKVDSLTELLFELTKDMDIGTTLLLTGVQPPGTNPLEDVRSLVVDKLELYDLDGKIEQAKQTMSGIVFDVSSPVDKRRILHRASTRLASSPQKIIDYRLNDADVYNIDVRFD